MDENKVRWITPVRAWESELEKEINDIILGLCLTLCKDNLIWKVSGASFFYQDVLSAANRSRQFS